MNLGSAQLGSNTNIGLGGYIPAAKKDKLSEIVLQQLVGNIAGQLGQSAVNRVMTPDLSEYASKQGVDLPAAKWYQNPVDKTTVMQAVQQQKQNERAVKQDELEQKKYLLSERGQDSQERYNQARLAAELAGQQQRGEESAADRKLREQQLLGELSYKDKSLGLEERGLATRDQLAQAQIAQYAAENLLNKQKLGISQQEAASRGNLESAHAALLQQQLAQGKDPVARIQAINGLKMQVGLNLTQRYGQGNAERINKLMGEYESIEPYPASPDDIQGWLTRMSQHVSNRMGK